MNIYWLVQQLDFIGGTEMVTSNIINQLSSDYSITVISTAKIENNKYQFNENVKVVSLNVPIDLCRIDYYYKQYVTNKKFLKLILFVIRMLYYYSFGIRKEKRIIKKMTTKDDLIIASSADGYILAPRKRKVAFHFHFNAKYFFSFSNLCLRRVIRKPDYYIFLTETTYKTVITKRKHIAKKRCYHIYNPVRFERNLTLSYHNNKIIFLGRFLHQKNPMFALKIAKELKNKNFPFELHMYGEGDFQKEMSTYVSKHQLTEVIIHPMTYNVNGVLSKADLLLVTSVFEGQSLVTIEANSQSVPVISTNWGDACHELIKQGKNGLVIESAKPVVFAEKIIEILSNQSEYLQLRKSAYESSKRFTPKEIRSKWIDFLQSIEDENN